MRKEIKRSLLLWPLVASAGLSVMSVMQINGSKISSGLSSLSSFGGPVMQSIWDSTGSETGLLASRSGSHHHDGDVNGDPWGTPVFFDCDDATSPSDFMVHSISSRESFSGTDLGLYNKDGKLDWQSIATQWGVAANEPLDSLDQSSTTSVPLERPFVAPKRNENQELAGLLYPTARTLDIQSPSTDDLTIKVNEQFEQPMDLAAMDEAVSVVFSAAKVPQFEASPTPKPAAASFATELVDVDDFVGGVVASILRKASIDIEHNSVAGLIDGSHSDLATQTQSQIGEFGLPALARPPLASAAKVQLLPPMQRNVCILNDETPPPPILDNMILELLPASNRPERALAVPKPSEVIKPQLPELETTTLSDGAVHVGDIPMLSIIESDEKAVSQSDRVESPAELAIAPADDAWPQTPRLDEQLGELSNLLKNYEAEEPGFGFLDWTGSVSSSLENLCSCHDLGSAEADVYLSELETLTAEGLEAGESLQDRELQVAMLRAAHALNRRLAVWRPVWEINHSANSEMTFVGDIPAHTAGFQSEEVDDLSWEIADAIAVLKADLDETGDSAGWSEFLLLKKINDAAVGKHHDPQTKSERAILAQRLLSRLDWHALEAEHLRWLRRDSVMNLASAVRSWNTPETDYAELLRQIERQESDAIDLAGIDIAGAVQSLRFSNESAAEKLASALDTHYRNANVRLAISQSMLDRLLPTVEPKVVPVRTTILGTRVRGVSQINSELSVRLTPAADRWMVNFETFGKVKTRSTGFNGPVSVRTRGNTSFVAEAPIEITTSGVDLGSVDVDVQGHTRLSGIASTYDSWPLIGALVRSFASSKYDSMKPMSSRIANGKVRAEIASEIEGELNDKIDAATDQISDMVLGPLGKMRLDPKVTDMQTTDQRLLARYRLAGDWQLAAFTPRPRAPRTSLMSVQAHQSSINNTLEQLVPRDDLMPIEDVLAQAAGMFGQSIDVPADIPAGVSIQFARTRPITTEIEDGTLWVTLRVVKLKRGEGAPLRNFIVRAAYRPETNGLQAYLVREGHLRISGPKMSMRTRLPVRTIFNKVLSPDRPLPLTLPSLIEHPAMDGLVISQLELRGGWLGLAISESNSPRIALKPN